LAVCAAQVYVFSTVDRDSFLEIERWRRKVEAECGPIVSVLVQNKVDLLDQAVVKSSEAEDLARRMGRRAWSRITGARKVYPGSHARVGGLFRSQAVPHVRQRQCAGERGL
jgi:GTPase SAR1 family protein